MITTANNQQLKYLVALMKKKRQREEDRCFVIEGRKMFFEVLRQAPERLQAVYFSESGYEELSEESKELVGKLSFELVSDQAFAKTAETVTPQGVLAIVQMPDYTFADLEKGGKVILLENLQDPGNLGTILRTSEAAGITGLLLSGDCVDMFNPKVVRATMGAILRVPFLYVEDFADGIRKLQEKGIRVFAADLEGSVPYTIAEYGTRYGILIGNEANGLKKETSALADERIHIPMEGKVESLNAAVACAVITYWAKAMEE